MIRNWVSLKPDEQEILQSELRYIFFESSSKKAFANEVEKERFWQHWTNYYFTNCPDLIFLYLVKDKLAGYLMGCADSLKAESSLKSGLPSYSLFADFFAQYPGHLHINLHPDYRGQGMGAQLISAFVRELSKRKIRGVHLVTAPEARNVSFYRQNGFDFEATRTWHDHPLLFIGREL